MGHLNENNGMFLNFVNVCFVPKADIHLAEPLEAATPLIHPFLAPILV